MPLPSKNTFNAIRALKRVAAHFTLLGLIILTVASPSTKSATEGLKIPNLGAASTSLFSTEFEYQLGRSWLKMFRSQAPIINDPLLYSYLLFSIRTSSILLQSIHKRIGCLLSCLLFLNLIFFSFLPFFTIIRLAQILVANHIFVAVMDHFALIPREIHLV